MTKLSIIFHSEGLSTSDESDFNHAMNVFPELLLQEPLNVSITTQPSPREMRNKLCETITHAQKSIEIDKTINRTLSKIVHPTCIVFACSPAHRIAQLASENNPNARWGGCFYQLESRFAWCCCPANQFAVWHESLHILGAHDCYDDGNSGPTCELDNCIMQYIPTNYTVRDWPFLCKRNCDRVRTRIAHLVSC